MVNMPNLVLVIAVEAIPPHRLRLTFEDGVSGVVDLSGRHWRGVFEPLADAGYFARVRLDDELGTVVWPNGADIAPETLYAWVREGVGAAS